MRCATVTSLRHVKAELQRPDTSDDTNSSHRLASRSTRITAACKPVHCTILCLLQP
jgi:hypothetical protein